LFLQVSTDEVMGECSGFVKFNELSSVKPRNPYAASKAAAEMLVDAARITHKLNTITIRMTNNYGTHQALEKYIPKCITNALQDKPIPVFGCGRQIRDWLHVDDSCRAIDALIHARNPAPLYCIGAEQERENIYVVKTILDMLGKPHSLIEHVEDRKAHDFRYAIDPAFIKQDLDWRPRVDFETGIYQTIDWYRRNFREDCHDN
jgi:dTDP-glucose 4,6-dehydratase